MHRTAAVIGVDIGGSGVKAAVVDTSTGRLLTERIRQETPQPATPDAVGLVVAGLVAQLATEVDVSSPVGCTVPSVVRNGVVLTAANIDPGWIGDHTADRLGGLLSRPVAVLNDADAAGLAEVRFGAARDVPGTVLVLTLGTGIGSALFRDGVLVPNTELGHAEFHGAAAEKYAAASVRKAQGLSWTDWTHRLSELLRHYSLLVAPDLVVLGGGVSRRADSFMPKLEVDVPVVVAGLGNAAGVVGAAMLAAERDGAVVAPGGTVVTSGSPDGPIGRGAARSGPLNGIRVVELAGLGPAPFAAMVLADLGADVLRLSRPDPAPIVPDATRPDTGNQNPYDLLNRNRRGVGLDLRSPDGAALARRLAGGADVLLEGFRPGVAERFGLGPDVLRGDHPGLVYGRMTGWGQEGPLAQRAGHDLTYLAVSGALAHIGRAGQPPTPPLNLVADFGGGGMLLVVGVLAALVERSVSGQGQVVDAAMVDGAAVLMAPLFGAWASGFWSADRGTNLLDSGAPFYDCYPCAGGGWLAVAAIEAPFYAQLLDGLGLADDADLPGQHDQARWPELRARLAAVIATRSRDDWADLFADRDACVAPVLDMGEAPHHPHAVARGSFVDIDGVAHPAPAPRFDRTPAAPPEAAWEHCDPVEVLGEWGVGPGEVAALVRSGVVT